jgi:glycosyltransferase involved in cell wall biosynthesis
MSKSVFFYILIRSWNSFEFFDKCINSVLKQNYSNYIILFVDDASPYSTKQKRYINKLLKEHVVVFNKKRKYSLRNAYDLINKHAKRKDAVIFNLDGDDWLLPNALSTVAKAYRDNPSCLFTYGECLIWNGKEISKKRSRDILEHANKPYKKSVVKDNNYRKTPFLPLHPRTWKVWLFKKINKEDFLRVDKTWIKYVEDQAIYFPMFEMAGERCKNLRKPIYVYNIANKYSITRHDLSGTILEELTIRRKAKYEKCQ